MASTSAATLSLPSTTTTLVDSKSLRQPTGGVSSLQCTIHSSLDQSQNRLSTRKTTAFCRKLTRNVITMASGEIATSGEAAVATETPEVVKKIQEATYQEKPTPAETVATETPEVVKNIQEAAYQEKPTPAETTVETDTPEIVKKIQEAWDKLEDKYAVTSLAAAGAVALWGSAGLLSAIDRLPLVPGVLELIGIGYTGWFAYKNLVNKPDREALIEKVVCTYKDIIGSS